MNRLQARFGRLRGEGRPALLPYVTGGYPDPQTTVEILGRLDPAVCACAEVGIPFSDPIADGPVIQTSFWRALAGGFRLESLLGVLRERRGEISVPLVAMVSYSIVYRRDPAGFVAAAREAGFDGLLIPDLAFEEAEQMVALGREADCPLVMMIAPTTAGERRARIAALSEPFIYYQSLAGVTGERSALPADLRTHVEELRRQTDKPICVGFGISRAAHVRQVCEVADGAIVGSALVRRLNAGVDGGVPRERLVDDVVQLVDELTAPLRC